MAFDARIHGDTYWKNTHVLPLQFWRVDSCVLASVRWLAEIAISNIINYMTGVHTATLMMHDLTLKPLNPKPPVINAKPQPKPTPQSHLTSGIDRAELAGR